MAENDFCKKSPVDSTDTLQSKILSLNAEIQDDRQKWLENDFCEKLSKMSKFQKSQLSKKFVKVVAENALSHSVSKINVFLRFLH